MNTWTLYTFGDGDLIAAILQAVALLVSGAMGSLLRAVAIGGLGLTLSMAAVGALAWTRAVSWLVGFLVVFTGLIQIAVPVAVEDVADTRIPPQVVQNVPLLVAMPAALSSELAYRTTLLATSLQLNGELGSGQTFLAPSINVQLLLSANLQPGDLRANIINYVNYCVAPPNSHLVNPPGTIPHSPDLFARLESTDEAIMVPTVVNGEIVGSRSCRQHYMTVLTPALAPLAPAADLGLTKTIEDLKCQIAGGRRIVGGPASCIDDAAFWDLLNSSLQALNLGISATADQVLVTAMLAKLLPEGEMDYAKRIMDEPAAIQIANDGLIKQLEIQSKAGADSIKGGLVRQIRAMADGTVLLGAPVLLALSATPLVWTFLGIYVRLFAWLALWGPIQAVTHFVALTMAASDVGGLAGVNGITAGNLHEVFLHLVQTNALGYDMLMAVPAIALAMAWGGVGALGGALQGAGTGLLRTSQDTWRRVESGESVLASSLTKGQVLAEGLRRPSNDGAFTTAQMQAAWAHGVASRSLQGSTVQTPDGRTITTMRDGSSRIQSPTQDVSVTPQGNKTGWQVFDQEHTVQTDHGPMTLSKGAYVRWTGHGAEVNLPSEVDPLTRQTVAPVGRFAQDPARPGGFGALQSKEWTVTQGALTYHATQGADGTTLYEVAGRTDLQVLNRDGTLTHATGDVRGMAVMKPGDTRPVIQATITALTQHGERLTADGTLTPPTEELVSGVMLFVPYTGEVSNVMEENRLATVSVNGQQGTMKAEHLTGTDGQGLTNVEIKTRSGTYHMAIPDNVEPGSQIPIQLTGVVPGVELSGGNLPPGTVVDLPVNANGTITLPTDLPNNWRSDTAALAQVIENGTVTLVPFTASVPDPTDKRRTLKVTVNELRPPGPDEARSEMAASSPDQTDPSPGVDVVTPTVRVQPQYRWVAKVASAESEATIPIDVKSAAIGMPGTFSLVGKTEIEGGVLKGRNVFVTYTAPNGGTVELGKGEVLAIPNPQTGQWELVSVKSASGIDAVQNGRFVIDAVETLRDVSAKVHKVMDPATGNVITSTATIGVTEQNLGQVRKAFRTGPVTFAPGGTIRIDNNGQATYEGPAEMLVQGQADGQPFEAKVQGMAKFQGTYNPETGDMAFWAGPLFNAKEIHVPSSQFTGSVADFFRTQAGQSGVVQLTADPNGRVMIIRGESGDKLTVEQNVRGIQQDVMNIEKNTLKIDPQTAFNAAILGDRRVLGEPIFLERDPAKQYSRAAAVATALAEELKKRISWEGQSQGDTTIRGSGTIDLQALIEKLPKKVQQKLSKLSSVIAPGASVQLGYRLTEQQVTDLFYNHLMDLYQQAREESGDDSGRAIARYTRDVSNFVQEMEQKVQNNPPSTYGTEAMGGLAAQLAEKAADAVSQGLEKAADAARDLAQSAADQVNRLGGQPGSKTPPPSGSPAAQTDGGSRTQPGAPSSADQAPSSQTSVRSPKPGEKSSPSPGSVSPHASAQQPSTAIEPFASERPSQGAKQESGSGSDGWPKAVVEAEQIRQNAEKLAQDFGEQGAQAKERLTQTPARENQPANSATQPPAAETANQAAAVAGQGASRAGHATGQDSGHAAHLPSGAVRPSTGQPSAGKVPDKPAASAAPAPASSSPSHKAGGPSPAAWRDILDHNPPVKQMLATAMDQFRAGDIQEPQFRDLVRSAFRNVYVGQSGSKSGKELDRAMETAHRAADEFVDFVVNEVKTQRGSSSSADQSAQKRATGKEIGSAAPAPNRPANQPSQSPVSSGSQSASQQGSGSGIASPRPSPLQTQSASPGDTNSSRTQGPQPSAAAGKPSEDGAVAKNQSETHDRLSGKEQRLSPLEHPPGRNPAEMQRNARRIVEDQSDENFVRVRQVMEDLAAKRIRERDVPLRVYELYRAQGIDLQGKVLVMGNWRFDFSDYRWRE